MKKIRTMPKLIQNDGIIKIETESGENTKVIVIDVDDGMSVVTRFEKKRKKTVAWEALFLYH